MPTNVTLDRAQREALTDELDVRVSEANDLRLYFEGRDRAGVLRVSAKLREYVGAMDAIGWRGPEQSPELVQIEADESVIAPRRLPLASSVKKEGGPYQMPRSRISTASRRRSVPGSGPSVPEMLRAGGPLDAPSRDASRTRSPVGSRPSSFG
jgi:hypothetical protein